MSTETPAPIVVPLSLGAIAFLVQMIAQTEWTSSPKEKRAAGWLKGRLEALLMSQPDPCLIRRDDPGFNAAQFAANKALREWRMKNHNLEMTAGEKIAVTSCVKFSANKPGGADEFFCELQDAFGITE